MVKKSLLVGKKAGFTKKMNGSKFIGIPQIIQVMDAHDLVLKAMVTWIFFFCSFAGTKGSIPLQLCTN